MLLKTVTLCKDPEGLKVKHIMEKYGISEDKAYAKLMGSELYSLLMDPETNLFLETNQYLCTACDLEFDKGVDALYEYVNQK